MFSLFKKKKKEIAVKRNFDNVSWEWINEVNGKQVNPFHVFSFKNGLGVIVMKHSVGTFDGMMVYAIDDFTSDFRFRRATNLGVYDHAGGLDEEGVIRFCDTIKNLKMCHTN